MSNDPSLSRAQTLVERLDLLAAQYGSNNPELNRDLVAFRADLVAALARKNRQEVALVALRVASWVRYVISLLSDD